MDVCSAPTGVDRRNEVCEAGSPLTLDNGQFTYVISKLDMNKVEKLINETPLISEVQRAFYKHMLNARYNKILLASFEKLG